MGLLGFGGAAAEAAQVATHHTTVLLDHHAGACEAVARAAEKAAEEVAAIKMRLQVIRDAAREHHLTIAYATGTALPPPDLSSYSPADQQAILNTAIRRASNVCWPTPRPPMRIWPRRFDAPPGTCRASRSMPNSAMRHPQCRRCRPPDSDPEEVKRWWHSLTPGQQDRVKQWFPNTLRNRDGIPIAVRNELNLSVLQRELTRLQNGWLSRDGVWHTDTDKLADLRALRDTLAAHPGTSLILLDTASDPRKVLAAVGVGDVDNAERVGVTMGGLNTRVSSSVGDMVKEAGIQRAKAAELRERAGWPNYDAVASIAWLGYDAPDGLKDVMHDWSARDAAGPLNRFDKGLAATTNVSDQHITAFGHSYGSLVTSLALQQGAPVSDVVLYGSPGTELTHASQLGVEPGHAFYMIGVNDHVANTIPEFGAFGSAPQDVPGMTQLSVNTGLAPGPLLGDGQLHERA